MKTDALKDKIIFSLSQQRGFGNGEWIMNIALDPKESIEMRKQALFWAGQNGGATTESFVALYDKMTDPEIKEQLIFVFSQRGRDPKAIDKLMAIAKNDKDKELRSKAVFWLGQSRDPRAIKYPRRTHLEAVGRRRPVRIARVLSCVVPVALATAPHVNAQTLAERVGAVKDGSVQMTYAARPDACGDGADVLALGRLITVHGSMQGHGWSNANCTFGPARVIVTRRDGEVANVRTYVGAPRRTAETTDLGIVSAREASAYFLGLVPSLNRRAAIIRARGGDHCRQCGHSGGGCSTSRATTRSTERRPELRVVLDERCRSGRRGRSLDDDSREVAASRERCARASS